MATNLIEQGATLQYANGASAAISSGDLVKVGGTFGVAATDIAKSTTGTLFMEGVFEIPAVETAGITQGNPVYQVTATGLASPTAEDQAYIGIAWETKASAGATVKVKLGCGYHPTVNDVT